MATGLSTDPGDDDLAAAIGEYVLGEISLGRAAERADMSRWEFEELLTEVGFSALYGPRDREQLRDEVNQGRDRE